MTGRPVVAVLNPGDPTDPAMWSGTPSGLVRGLSAAGANVVPVSVDLPGRVQWLAGAVLAPAYAVRARAFEGRSRAHVAHSTAQICAVMSAARGRRTRAAITRLRPDGAVAINLAFPAPADVPTMSFEDMTIPQALSHFDYAHWSALSAWDRDRRIAMQRTTYQSVTVCGATNSWAATSMVEDYGVAPERVRVLGVGSNFPPLDIERDWSVPRFLFVGREWERKNGPAIMRAFAAVRERHPDAELHLVGGHPPVDAPGVIGHGVLRLGDDAQRARLRELFARATCFVMPSLLEPSAVAYTEAAAAGIASIGTSAGGSADLIGDAGVVGDPHDDAAIATAMLRLADPQTAAAFGARAVERAPLLTWSAVGARVLAGLGLGPEPAPLVRSA